MVGELRGLRVAHLDQAVVGRSTPASWQASDAEIVAYCDVDLSTDLNALMPLASADLPTSGVAIGTRLARASRVVYGEAGIHLPQLQPHPAYDDGRQVLRRAVRFQGDARRASRTSCCHHRRHRLVRRHRICWSCPGLDAQASSPRCRWTGSTTSTAASTSSPPPSPTSRVRPGRHRIRPRPDPRRRTAAIGRDRAPGPDLDGVPYGLMRASSSGSASSVWPRRWRTRSPVLDAAQHLRRGVANFLALGITAGRQRGRLFGSSAGWCGPRDADAHQLLGLGVFLFGWAMPPCPPSSAVGRRHQARRTDRARRG